MELVVKPFGDLTPWELYELLRLRVDVFVVEQHCPYPELDGRDPEALHVFLREGDRVLGRRILDAGIQAARERLGAEALTIEAQTYARGFYEAAGFRQVSQEFLEDGNPPILMRRELGAVPHKEADLCGM